MLKTSIVPSTWCCGLPITLACAVSLSMLATQHAAAQELPPEPLGAPPPDVRLQPSDAEPTTVPADAFPAPRAEAAEVPAEDFPAARSGDAPGASGAVTPQAAASGTLAADATPGPPKGDAFAITSGGGNYKLRIGLQTGIKAEGLMRDGDLQDRNPFFVIRPSLSGHVVAPWIKYWFSMELANNPPYLLDGYIDLNPCDELGLRVGQQYTPFSRHETFGPQQLLFPEFSIVANYFWSGRDKGATVFGSVFGKRLDYFLGFYGGSPLRQFSVLDGNYVVQGRFTYSPLGPTGDTEYPYIVDAGAGPAPFRPSFTINGYYGKIRTAVENFNPSTFSFVPTPSDTTTKNGTAGVDVLLQSSHFAFFAEGYYRRTQPGTGVANYSSWGAWGQLGVLLVPRRLDIAVRGSWINPSTHVDDDRFLSIEGQLAYYISAPNVVVKLRYGYAVQQVPATSTDTGDMTSDAQESPDMSTQSEVVLPAVTGKLHLVTLQINLSF